jgi:hypothetical protein
MSAQLSSTASEPIGPRKKQIELSPCLRAPDFDINKEHLPEKGVGHGSAAPSIVDLSRTFLLDSPTLAQPLRMLVVTRAGMCGKCAVKSRKRSDL